MRDNIFLIMFCVLFIVLDTLVLGYSIGRIYPPISQQVSAQSTTSSVRFISVRTRTEYCRTTGFAI